MEQDRAQVAVGCFFIIGWLLYWIAKLSIVMLLIYMTVHFVTKYW